QQRWTANLRLLRFDDDGGSDHLLQQQQFDAGSARTWRGHHLRLAPRRDFELLWNLASVAARDRLCRRAAGDSTFADSGSGGRNPEDHWKINSRLSQWRGHSAD